MKRNSPPGHKWSLKNSNAALSCKTWMRRCPTMPPLETLWVGLALEFSFLLEAVSSSINSGFASGFAAASWPICLMMYLGVPLKTFLLETYPFLVRPMIEKMRFWSTKTSGWWVTFEIAHAQWWNRELFVTDCLIPTTRWQHTAKMKELFLPIKVVQKWKKLIEKWGSYETFYKSFRVFVSKRLQGH